MLSPSSFIIEMIAIWLLSWGVGSLMRTIGKIRGWNAGRTFWVSAILYGLLTYAVYLLGRFTPALQTIYGILIIGSLVIGVLSPIINLAIKRAYPNTFAKSSSSRETASSSHQKEQIVNSGNTQSFKPRTLETPVEKKSDTFNPDVIASRIFISYRRSDSADIAGRIYDRLIGRFEKKMIFKDVDSIPLGLDFKEYLDKQVGECNVLLAIIGDRWMEASNASGKRRLDDPTDFVRIEIESALERNIPVIPLLVRGAQMPEEENLPSSLRKLVYRNGIPIRPDPDFHRDMDRLIKALEGYVG